MIMIETDTNYQQKLSSFIQLCFPVSFYFTNLTLSNFTESVVQLEKI